MIPKYQAAVEAHIKRAYDSIAMAEILLEKEYFDGTASHAYYAAFNACAAALLKHELVFKRHGAVIAEFNRLFVKTGSVEKSVGSALNELFELRIIGDYGENRHVQLEDARNAVEAAKKLISAVERIIEGD